MKKILFVFLMLISLSAKASSVDTLFNHYPFLIYFDRIDTTMHFMDLEKKFHCLPKGANLFDIDSFRGIELYPATPNLISQIDNFFFFSFSMLYSSQGVDNEIQFFFKYDRIHLTFQHLRLADHFYDYHLKGDRYDFCISYQGCPLKQKISIKKQRGKIYLFLSFTIHFCNNDIGKQRFVRYIKKKYVEDGIFFLRTYMKETHKPRFVGNIGN